jgi:hypothetical protein
MRDEGGGGEGRGSCGPFSSSPFMLLRRLDRRTNPKKKLFESFIFIFPPLFLLLKLINYNKKRGQKRKQEVI